MAVRRAKSKKLSAGNAPSPSPPEEIRAPAGDRDFVFYLDENLCNTRAILEILRKLEVPHERHLAHFPRGVADEIWLPFVGRSHWILLTSDKRIRYNLLEKRALQENLVREFVFTSGNMSGDEMAKVLALALPKMRRLCRRLSAPFVAAITRSGEVHVRWPTL